MSANIAIVTGANKGLGLAIVKGLCKKFNGTVYLTSRDVKRGEKACEDLTKSGLNPVFHQLDVTDEESVSMFRDHIRSQGQVDVLVNNAAILFLKDATEPKTFQAEKTVFVNFFSLVNFCESMLPLMKKGGKIVNISSSSGHLSRIPSEELRKRISCPELTVEELKVLMNSYVNSVKLNREIEDGWGESPYVVSKNGVNAYTFILHRKLADRGITVNCVHPGYVITDMTQGAGNVTPEQAAEVPLRLALQPQGGGHYVWHNGMVVPWDGQDPREYINQETL